MFRDLLSRIMIVFRLAIVVSLVGYTLPNANAAMHGSAYDDLAVVAVEADHHDHGLPAHAAMQDDSDASHHQPGKDAGGKLAKNDCCQDFCFSMALPSGYDAPEVLAHSSIREFNDDTDPHGQPPSLHRPPNI